MSAGVIDALAPLIACVLCFGIPIIAILVKHQQKMAMIYRDQGMQQETDQFVVLRHDVDNLKATLNQQTIVLDQIASQQRELIASLKAGEALKERLTQ